MSISWPMSRQWVRILKQPLNKRIDEAVQEDVAQDQREGIYRDATLAFEGSVSSHEGESTMASSETSPSQAWTTAPSLHALAMAAAESVSHSPLSAASQHAGNLSTPSGPLQQHPQPPHGVSYYTLPGPYSEMPFGDPSQPQSYSDVVSFMDGVEQWNWTPQV
jgi:hypothetical protein